MIAKFNTQVPTKSGGSNFIIWGIALAGLAYLGYRFFIQNKKEEKPQ
jgi:hypothetical protein